MSAYLVLPDLLKLEGLDSTYLDLLAFMKKDKIVTALFEEVVVSLCQRTRQFFAALAIVLLLVTTSGCQA